MGSPRTPVPQAGPGRKLWNPPLNLRCEARREDLIWSVRGANRRRSGSLIWWICQRPTPNGFSLIRNRYNNILVWTRTRYKVVIGLHHKQHWNLFVCCIGLLLLREMFSVACRCWVDIPNYKHESFLSSAFLAWLVSFGLSTDSLLYLACFPNPLAIGSESENLTMLYLANITFQVYREIQSPEKYT